MVLARSFILMDAVRKYKAFIYDSKGTNGYNWKVDLPMPKVGSNQVLLKVISGGLNPLDYKLPHIGTAKYMINGSPVGSDVCGKVVTVGSGVTSMAVGDTVFGFGSGCTEYTVVKDTKVVKVPEGAKDVEAYGGLGVAGLTAYQMLKLTGSFDGPDGKKILVIGASGGVGSCAIQIARALCPNGTRIFAICSDRSVEYVKSIGADEIIDYSKEGFAFSTCVPQKSMDVILDAVSSPDDYNYAAEGMSLLKDNTGRYIAINSASKIDLLRMVVWAGTGLNLFRSRYQVMPVVQRTEDLSIVGRLVHEGKLKLNVQEYVKFEESAIRRAMDTLAGRRVRGKLIVKVD